MDKKPKEDVQDTVRELGRAGGCVKNHTPYVKRNGIVMQVSDQGRRTWPAMCQEHLAGEQLQIRRENLPRWGRGSRNKQPGEQGCRRSGAGK